VAVSKFVVCSVFGRAIRKCSPTEFVWSPAAPGAENPAKEEVRLDMCRFEFNWRLLFI